MIVLKSPEEIDKLRTAGRIVAEILQILIAEVKPGISTDDLDGIAEGLIKQKGAKPAFKGYRGYPKVLCASVNNEIVHGIPGKKVLKEGDLISLDFGVIYEGWFGDSARSIAVGQASPAVQKLLDVAWESLNRGLAEVKAGNRVHDISWAVQNYVEVQGYSVVKDFVGHGIGRNLHEEPQIPNYGTPHTGARLNPGLVIAIEPMVNSGSDAIEILDDGWTAITKDGSLSAHVEDTIAITERGPEILTRL